MSTNFLGRIYFVSRGEFLIAQKTWGSRHPETTSEISHLRFQTSDFRFSLHTATKRNAVVRQAYHRQAQDKFFVFGLCQSVARKYISICIHTNIVI